MSTLTQNGRPLAEAFGTPVVTDQGPSRHGDSAQSNAATSPEQAQRHSLEAVGVGIDRFLAEFRESFGTDMEAELTELGLCKACGLYPSAWMQKCFTCNAAHRLPSC